VLIRPETYIIEPIARSLPGRPRALRTLVKKMLRAGTSHRRRSREENAVKIVSTRGELSAGRLPSSITPSRDKTPSGGAHRLHHAHLAGSARRWARESQVQENTTAWPFTATIEVEVVEWEPPHRWREICIRLRLLRGWYVSEKLDEQAEPRQPYSGEATLKGIMKCCTRWPSRCCSKQTNAKLRCSRRRLDALGAQRGTAVPQGG